MVELLAKFTALSDWISPEPPLVVESKPLTCKQESRKRLLISRSDSSGFACSTRAAAAAAAGAEAEVPKNSANTLVVPPSGARKAGAFGLSGVGSALPFASKRICPGPAEENDSA